MMAIYFGRIKKSKYGNKKTVMDGIKFDSMKEANRYSELSRWQDIEFIKGLEVHPKFSIDVNGVHVCNYIADFKYERDGVMTVEDVKSEPSKTAVYRLKKKLIKAVCGIEIKEI